MLPLPPSLGRKREVVGGSACGVPLAIDAPHALMTQAPKHLQRDATQAAAQEALRLLVLNPLRLQVPKQCLEHTAHKGGGYR